MIDANYWTSRVHSAVPLGTAGHLSHRKLRARTSSIARGREHTTRRQPRTGV